MQELALYGGTKVRNEDFPHWPRQESNDIAYINEVLQSGCWWRGMGPSKNTVSELESKFKNIQNSKFGLAVTSGTAALNISVAAMNFETGAEVIVTPYTYAASAFCIVNSGLIPVFVDIDPHTYNIKPESISESITEKTRGIMLVHFAGNPVNFDKIMPIVKKHNLKVIEDCAHSYGAEWRKSLVGSFGDVACFSFHSSKNLTCGEGGFITTSDENIFEKCWMQHNMGRKFNGEWYSHYNFGENLRFSPINAALLLSQMEKFEDLQNQRRTNMNYFKKLLKDIKFLKPLVVEDVAKHGLHLFVCRYKQEEFYGIPRYRFIAAIQAEGIPVHMGYKFPLYYNRPLRKFLRSCPNAEEACFKEAIWFDQNLFLGTKKDVEDIVDAIYKVANNYGKLLKKEKNEIICC